MINLLPVDEKRQLRAARSNTLLIRYNFFLLGVVAFLGIATTITYVYLTTAKANAEQTITESRAKVGNFAAVQAQADTFRSNLTTAKQILDQEVAYTKVILEIAQLLPSGVVLKQLNLDAKTFGTETVLAAHAKSYDNAIALKEAFEKSTIFSNVHFQSINTGDSAQSAGYPITVNLYVTIKKDAAKQ